MHYVDWLAGLLPVRDFIDQPGAAMAASTLNGAACSGPMWLLPSSGDQGEASALDPEKSRSHAGMARLIRGLNQLHSFAVDLVRSRSERGRCDGASVRNSLRQRARSA